MVIRLKQLMYIMKQKSNRFIRFYIPVVLLQLIFFCSSMTTPWFVSHEPATKQQNKQFRETRNFAKKLTTVIPLKVAFNTFSVCS